MDVLHEFSWLDNEVSTFVAAGHFPWRLTRPVLRPWHEIELEYRQTTAVAPNGRATEPNPTDNPVNSPDVPMQAADGEERVTVTPLIVQVERMHTS
jgi:hypothetical protein